MYCIWQFRMNQKQGVSNLPNITVELNDKGEMIGIEILEASCFIRDSIMESVQARVLRVPEFQPAR